MWLDGTRDIAVPAFPVRIFLTLLRSFSSHPAPARDSQPLPPAGERQDPECHGTVPLEPLWSRGLLFSIFFFKEEFLLWILG